MKIAIIGTSHTVCIKAGFDLVSDDIRDAFDVEFFAVAVKNFRCFEQESDGILRAVRGSASDCEIARKQAVNFNGKAEIDLSGFDAICVVGAQTGIDAVSRLIAQVDFGAKPCEKLEAMTFISSNTLAGIQADLIEDALQSWMLLKQDKQKQFLMPPPFLFEKFLDWRIGGKLGERTKEKLYGNPVFKPTVLRYIERLRSALLEKTNVRLLRQPEATLSEHQIISNSAFCHGATSLRGDVLPSQDFTHGNADYGALFWRDFSRTILSHSK